MHFSSEVLIKINVFAVDDATAVGSVIKTLGLFYSPLITKLE
jgi:hypothetical protein